MDLPTSGLPPYMASQGLAKVATGKGEAIMNSLLLNQYQNSPNLKEYFMAFISEMDFLFEQIEEVHIGRFLEFAVGKQLDVCGVILQQSRSVSLPESYFGFVGAIDAGPMADKAEPSIGGTFRDFYGKGGITTPMDDETFRKVLIAKAVLLNRDTIDISLAYMVVCILLGRTPSVFEIRDSTSGIGLGVKQVDLLLGLNEANLKEKTIIAYMSQYFVPSGVTFTITQV